MNKRTFTFPSDAKARNYMVHFGSRRARDCLNSENITTLY